MNRDEYVEAAQSLFFMVQLGTEFAGAARRLATEAIGAPTTLATDGLASALLATASSRAVLRYSERALTFDLGNGPTTTLTDAVGAFKIAHPDLKIARDLIEHSDEYLTGGGRLRAAGDDFSLYAHRDPGRYQLVVGNRYVDLGPLADDAVDLAAVLRDSVTTWSRWMVGHLDPDH